MRAPALSRSLRTALLLAGLFALALGLASCGHTVPQSTPSPTVSARGDLPTAWVQNAVAWQPLAAAGCVAQALKWLLRPARIMARQGKATQAWWTKTTLELALRAVEPGHWQKPSAKNSRPTYLLVMRGAFVPWSYPEAPGPKPVPWGFWVIDPTTHLVDEAGCTGAPPSTGSLELHAIDLKSLPGM
jgi:hypothetical protein